MPDSSCQGFRIQKDALIGIACNILKEYDRGLINGEPAAIPIEEIAERHFGLTIEYQCIRKNGRLLGETVFDDMWVPVYNLDAKRYEFIYVKRGTILLDESLLRYPAKGRLRFTCAHELSHWVLHQGVYCGFGKTAALYNSSSSSEDKAIERQADILGVAMLMPKGQVKKAYYNMPPADRNSDPIAVLAGLFDVSKEAMGIFMREHNII